VTAWTARRSVKAFSIALSVSTLQRSVLLTAEQVADVAGAEVVGVRSPERRIPHVKLGRYVRFEREQLDTWLVPICAGTCCYSPRSVVPRVYRASVTDLRF
jgi:hypothetical protein